MKNILIVDIETTRFSHTKGSIVEIGIVVLDLDTGYRLTIFDKVMREEKTTREELDNSWIINNSSMTSDEVLSAKTFQHYKPEIQDIINKYELGSTAFNNIFDNGFLESRGIVFKRRLGCPMRLSKNIVNAQGKNGIKNPSFQEAYDCFFPNNNYVELHRGASDAYREAGLVFELYKRGIFKI